MASGIITEGILIIASVVVAAILSGIVISQVGSFDASFAATTQAQEKKVLTKIEVTYAVTDSSALTANVWVKNVGVNPITNPESVEVYFGQLGSVQRIPYNTGSSPEWVYNGGAPADGVWDQMETLQIDITDGTSLSSGVTYLVRVVTPNGVTDDYVFTFL